MILAIVFLVLGLVLLFFSAEYLVKGASNIATALEISPLIVGLTVVSFGTSAPELAVSVFAAFKGQPDLAVGNVVGSSIFNVLMVVGASALIVPLVVHRQLIRFDVPVMIGVSVVLYALCYDGELSRLDGVILFSLVLVYTVVLIGKGKKEKGLAELVEFDAETKKGVDEPGWGKNILLVVVGIGGLVLGSNWLVDGSVTVARFFGVSELIIGLTIVSVGTSLPELATSIVAAIRGEKDIAIGNVVGSNIFNISVVLGLSSIIAPAGIAVSGHAISFDLLFMLGVAVATLPIFYYGYSVGRKRGTFLILFYGIYLGYLVLEAMNSGIFPQFREILLIWVAPLTGVVLFFLLFRSFQQEKNRG